MWRIVKLLRVAAEAEGLRWRRTGRGLVIRLSLVAAAAIFFVLLLVMLHLAGFAWFSPRYGTLYAALILAGVDLVLAALFGWLATRDTVDPIAAGAAEVRDDALRQAGDQAARAAVIMPLLRSGGAKKGILGAALTAAVVGLMSRR